MTLFDRLTIREVELRNRIVVSPMCEYSSEDGFANDWHLVHLGSRAVGGAAVVMTEAAAVEPEGRISPQDLGIWKNEHIEPLRRIVRFLEEHGAVPAMQLAHAGRKASTAAPWNGGKPVGPDQGGWTPICAPSPIPFDHGYQTPKALDERGIRRIVNCFADAAERCLEAGFKLIEIHAAHGYLLHEFLSPLSNHREDAYGGSLENRARIVRELVKAVRKHWPEHLPLWIRFSCSDWADGGWQIHEAVQLARMLKPLGVDLVDCSSGGLVPTQRIPVGPGYQVAFAEQIRREAGIMTGAVGMITSATQAETIIRTGQADVVLLARELLRRPYWPLHAARILHCQDVAWPKQYLRAKD